MARSLSWLERLHPIAQLRVRFRTVDELAEVMPHLAVVLDKQLDEFVARYEPTPTPNARELAQSAQMWAGFRVPLNKEARSHEYKRTIEAGVEPLGNFGSDN